VEIKGSNPYFCIEDGVLYNKDKTILYYYPTYKPQKSGNAYIMPDSVRVAPVSFNSYGLEKLKLSKNLEKVPPFMCYGCFNLETVEIPKDSVCKEIGDYAFVNCNFDQIYLPEGLEEIGKGAFMYCFDNSWLDGALVPIKCAEDYDSYFEKLNYRLLGLKSITIPSTCKIIGTSAFEGCGCLKSVYLSEGLEKIGDRAFFDCYSKTTFEGFAKNLNVSYEEFKKENLETSNVNFMVGLSSITIPSTCKYIGKEAFSGCKKLTSLNMNNGAKIPTTVEFIGKNAFLGCSFKTLDLDTNFNQFSSDLNLFSSSVETLITGDNLIAATMLKDMPIKVLKYKGSKTDFIRSDLYSAVSHKLGKLKIEYLVDEEIVNWSHKGSNEIDFSSFENIKG
jgi:hypothetical protein